MGVSGTKVASEEVVALVSDALFAALALGLDGVAGTSVMEPLLLKVTVDAAERTRDVEVVLVTVDDEPPGTMGEKETHTRHQLGSLSLEYTNR